MSEGGQKQGFFTALKVEVARGLSPGRSRPWSPAPSARDKAGAGDPDPSLGRSASLRLTGEALAPLMEGPDPEGCTTGGSKRFRSGLGSWVWDQLMGFPSGANENGSGNKRSDLRLLLGVMGAPLAPVNVSLTEHLPHLCIKNTPIEASSAQYILQQYTAACGGQKVQSLIKNAYAMGKLKIVASEFETATKVVKHKNTCKSPELGSFVLWQMNPDMWYVELAVGGSKVRAGCNGKIVWRHTPWLGAHAAKGPVRPLRRALQGLDPRTTASIFADAICTGEKTIDGEDCFILKLSADHEALKARSEGPAEIIRHALFGYFSQRTGLLVHLEDSHLTRIQSGGGDAVYWETTTSSFIGDYRPVEGVMVAHSGRSVVTLFRFGEAAMSHTKTRMEEEWTIDEVAFNVPGLSVDYFIPPGDLRTCLADDEISQEQIGSSRLAGVGLRSAKVAALEG
ncbi:Protein of unknown function (DUF620 [Striga hermonthica]|uniref:Uncharacterized protein n=1 Tax=Striga hermonthica TaxID=68872 RepID=A0A9N7N3U5_STRHE|nr:Protein of unknown function (DUF620 [Striga hermonthica]